MIKRFAAFLTFVLITAVASATPVITSVTPNSSTVNGGIHITIKGSGFATCPICSPPVPPNVSFGLTPATAVMLLDGQTLDVVVPPHFPGLVDVFVLQYDGTAVLRDAFTFTGQTSDAFETILLPIYSPPVHGAFGSEFHTIVRAATSPTNNSTTVTPTCLKVRKFMTFSLNASQGYARTGGNDSRKPIRSGSDARADHGRGPNARKLDQ